MAVAGALTDVRGPQENTGPEEPQPPGRRTAVLLLVLAAVLFLGFAARMISAPFGDSHDGRNAGVWAAGSRSLREHGPIDSRLGTHTPENGVYANHPPLVYVETALFEALAGTSTAATRTPAWIGSLAVLGLLTALLLQAGLRPSAVGASVVLVAATPMFLVYGSMLDTPVTSLPFGLAVLLVWERSRTGRRVPWPLAAGLTALAVLSGWQALLVAAVVGAWALVRLVRRSSGSRTTDAAFVGGALVGAALLTGWLFWAFGGAIGPLLDQLAMRTGQSVPVPLADVLGTIGRDTAAMFGAAALLAIGGLVVACRNRRTRGLAAIAMGVALPYPLIFRGGTVNHDYWNYWFLLLVAVGLAAGADRLLQARGAMAGRQRALVAAAVLMAVSLTVIAWVRPGGAELSMRDGVQAGDVVENVVFDPAQRIAWYTGAVGKPAGWLSLATRRPAQPVNISELPRLAQAHPRDLVLASRVRCVNGNWDATYAFETAAGLVDRPLGTDDLFATEGGSCSP